MSIRPLNDFGTVVSPSKVWNKSRNGNSLKCERQTTHCSGLFICCTIKPITPVLQIVFNNGTVTLQYTKFVQGKPMVSQMGDNAVSDVFSRIT